MKNQLLNLLSELKAKNLVKDYEVNEDISGICFHSTGSEDNYEDEIHQQVENELSKISTRVLWNECEGLYHEGCVYY